LGEYNAPAMRQSITGWHQDEVGDWVAELSCGHGQHVRHSPPLSFRAWVLTPEGRASFIGFALECVRCDEEVESPHGVNP
jgi:tellurite methyltransferase